MVLQTRLRVNGMRDKCGKGSKIKKQNGLVASPRFFDRLLNFRESIVAQAHAFAHALRGLEVYFVHALAAPASANFFFKQSEKYAFAPQRRKMRIHPAPK